MKRQILQQFLALSGASLALLFLFPTQHFANSFPVVESVTLGMNSQSEDEAFNLTENGTRTLYIWGSISDADGCTDITEIGEVTAQFWRGSTGPNCGNDGNYCYQAAAEQCSYSACTGPSDVDLDYQCTFEIQYYADSTVDGPYANEVWNGRVVAKDGFLAQGTKTDTIEMNSLIGMEVADLDYGNLDLGSTSSVSNLNIYNTGNTAIDINMQASGDLSCSGAGSIPLGQARYSESSSTSWEEATPLTTSEVGLELDINPRSNEQQNDPESLYFQLKMPDEGVSGVCSNSIFTTAVADSENGW